MNENTSSSAATATLLYAIGIRTVVVVGLSITSIGTYSSINLHRCRRIYANDTTTSAAKVGANLSTTRSRICGPSELAISTALPWNIVL